MKLRKIKSEEALPLKYDLMIYVDENGDEKKLERFTCPCCLNSLARKLYGVSSCPVCSQKLDWNKL